MSNLSQSLAVSVLASIKKALTRADAKWDRLFGNPTQLVAKIAQKYPVYNGEPQVEVDLDFGQLIFPGALAREWLFSQSLKPAEVSSFSEVRQPMVYSNSLLIPALRIPAIQQNLLTSGKATIEDRSGALIAEILTESAIVMTDSACLEFLARHLECVAIDNLLPPRTQLRVEELLKLPAAFIKTTEKHKNEALLGAADLGFVNFEEFPRNSPLSLPQTATSPLRVGMANIPRRKLFSHALTARHAFDQFLKLYQVLEHKFLEAHIQKIQSTLAAGHVVVARTLLSSEKTELERLSSVISGVFAGGGISVSKMKLPYPSPGHSIYLEVGMDSTFDVSMSAKNIDREMARLVYKIRCAIVHTKSDQSYLQPTPVITAALEQHIIPDLLLIARYLVEN